MKPLTIYQIRTEHVSRRDLQRLRDLERSSHPDDQTFYKAWYNPEGHKAFWIHYEHHMKILSKEFPKIVFWLTGQQDDGNRFIQTFENGKVCNMMGEPHSEY